MDTVVRLEGAVESIVQKLLAEGYYKTKAEIIRAGILELGREYRLIGFSSDQFAVRKMARIDAEIEAGNRKLKPLGEVMKKYGVKA
ncbi:MAG: hypothetical protein V1644_01030 [Candidatus Micrarchaeota archaeon]